jgi:diguanylate cyclase (GGDEF)-like protein
LGQLDLSPLAVTVQAVGTLLLALMLAQLGRVFGRSYATRWAIGWGAFFLALLSVRVFIFTANPAWWMPYVVLEWVFLFLLYSGARELATGAKFDVQPMLYAIPLAITIAAVITHFAPSFNDLFSLQAAIIAAATAATFVLLARAPAASCSAGCRIMRAALLSMSLLYASYVPLYIYYTHVHPFPLLEYSSLADLLVAAVLGFGMIVTTAEHANRELQDAMRELDYARSAIEQKLHIDPLTEALNRHAFHAMQRGDEIDTRNSLVGVVVMIDVDNLKYINDALGHAAGDAVIRASANAVRLLIRADDLLFRWGGDEFVAIIPNLTLATVSERMAPLTEGITARVSASGPPIKFTISWGGAEFDDKTPLDRAMKLADQRMYEQRSVARAGT